MKCLLFDCCHYIICSDNGCCTERQPPNLPSNFYCSKYVLLSFLFCSIIIISVLNYKTFPINIWFSFAFKSVHRHQLPAHFAISRQMRFISDKSRLTSGDCEEMTGAYPASRHYAKK